MSAHHDRRLVRVARALKSERMHGLPARFAPRRKRRTKSRSGAQPTPSSNPKRARKNASGLSGRQWVRFRRAQRWVA